MLRTPRADDDVIKDGALVVVYERHDSMRAVYVAADKTHQNRFGMFDMKDWVGKPYGCIVQARNTQGWIYLLRPTPELWSLTVRFRTQILYAADNSLICTMLQLKPGCTVLETGTGTGSLTTSLARCVVPTGHVYTFEFHEGRANAARDDFIANGMGEYITVEHRNTVQQGFPEALHRRADAVFLDLPLPAPVIASAAACLKPDGVLCSFSPCIEQVLGSCEEMVKQGFVHVRTFEFLLRAYEVSIYPINELDEGSPKEGPGEQGDDGTPGEGVPGEGEEDAHAGDKRKAKWGSAGKKKGGGKKYTGPAGQLFQPKGMRKTVVTRPIMGARGHTGYLTFARLKAST